MELVYFGFIYLLLLISIFNFFSIRIPANTSPLSHSLTVLLPVRNEEKNIEKCIGGLKSQIGMDQLKIIIINDQSTDKTVEKAMLAIKDDSRFSIMNTSGPRSGWLGKVSALQSGYEASDSDLIMTLDADVHLEPTAIAASVNLLKDLNLDFISPYPQQVALTFAEKLVQPLLHWSWMTTVILRLAEKVPHTSTAIANGQFFIAQKKALDRVSGFSSVSNKILDDIEIARSLVKAGYRGTVVEGAEIAQTRMYQNFSEIKMGYGKSLHKAFGGLVGTIVAVFFIFITGIFPLMLALFGSSLGWILYFAVVMTRLLSDTKSKSDSFYALLHPLSALILLYLICYSWLNRGSIEWKGRTV